MGSSILGYTQEEIHSNVSFTQTGAGVGVDVDVDVDVEEEATRFSGGISVNSDRIARNSSPDIVSFSRSTSTILSMASRTRRPISVIVFVKLHQTSVATQNQIKISSHASIRSNTPISPPLPLRLESPSLKLFGIISVISAGVLLSVAKETEFEFWGFVFVMLAAVMSGFRWCMTQVLLQKETYGLKNPFTFMSYVAPVMAIVTGLLSLLLDPWSEFRDNIYFDSGAHFTRTCFLMLFGGALAFCMVLTEYILVSVTSAVTVTIAGVVKEAVTIVVNNTCLRKGDR
ncbi:hypothetical protein F2Q70_00038055 [Brassica cretica]|uniref:Sugar phosphate transporter domain-containing protein n=1 Tax=Brassica cretica TaxID=69181 RepID=A0A8S9KB70_BRACR|nr:hypothetical protein F2Q70_00038055 [Brassica cretica]